MKFLCAHCERLLDLTVFRVDGEALVVICPRCGQENRSGPAPEAAVAPGVGAVPQPRFASSGAAPAVPLPKPVTLTSSPQASNVVMLRTPHVEAVEKAAQALEGNPFAAPGGFCPKCLAVRPPSHESCAQCGLIFKQLAPATLEVSDWLGEAWRALLLDWGSEGAHDLLRLRCARENELVPLARLYRIRLAAMPDDPYAQRGRDEVLRLASAPVSFLTSRAEPSRPSTRRWVVGVAVAFCLLALAGLALAVFQAMK